MNRIDQYGKPTCQFRDCDNDAEETREHPDHGDVDVCEHHATFWE